MKGDSVVSLGQKQGIKNGDNLFVVRKRLVTTDDGKSLFSELVRVGIIEVISVNDVWSKARIIRLVNGMTAVKKDDLVSPDPVSNSRPLISTTPFMKNFRKGETILKDDMQKNQYLSVMNNEGDSYQLGKLNITSPLKNDFPASCFYPPPFNQLQNFILEGKMEFNHVEGGRNSYFKIYFRSNTEPSKQFKGYVLYLNAMGQYAVSVDGNEYNNFLIPFTSTPLLNRGMSENKFRIMASGSRFDIHINDKYLISFEDELYTQGTIGLLAKQGTSVTVSNISIWKIEKDAADVPSVPSSASALGGALVAKVRCRGCKT